MNKKYAIEIIEMLERRMLERESSLAKEAIRYLERLKINKEIKDRIYKIKFN